MPASFNDFFDNYYFIIFLVAFVFSIYAQMKVSSAFEKYSKVRSQKGYTGAEVAKQILNRAGIYDVQIERTRGSLTDHYDPRSRVLRLSESVYNSNSLAAVGVAAHETGHAIQDEEGYAFLTLRSALVPIANFGSKMAMPLIFIGFLLGGAGSVFGNTMFQIGIIFFALVVVFSLITLPVEFNASNRAIALLEGEEILSYNEIGPAKKVLSAAAMTYIAAAAVSILQLLRLMSLGRRRN